MPLLPSPDRGKSRLALPEEVATAISEVVGAACAVLHKEMVTARKSATSASSGRAWPAPFSRKRRSVRLWPSVNGKRPIPKHGARVVSCSKRVMLFDCLLPVY